MTDESIPLTLQLAGAGFHLRPWREPDAPALAEAARESVADVGRWLPWCSATYDLPDAVQWIAHCRRAWQQGDQYAFAILDEHEQLLGSVDLKSYDRRQPCANVGYWMRSSQQRRGICTRAVVLLAAFGFERLGLQRLEIVAAEQNLPSRRVAEKSGAHFEGLARRRLLVHGQALDAAVYSLVPGDHIS
jgi:ribosomal-protein-serine acetyltransferase